MEGVSYRLFLLFQLGSESYFFSVKLSLLRMIFFFSIIIIMVSSSVMRIDPMAGLIIMRLPFCSIWILENFAFALVPHDVILHITE